MVVTAMLPENGGDKVCPRPPRWAVSGARLQPVRLAPKPELEARTLKHREDGTFHTAGVTLSLSPLCCLSRKALWRYLYSHAHVCLWSPETVTEQEYPYGPVPCSHRNLVPSAFLSCLWRCWCPVFVTPAVV